MCLIYKRNTAGCGGTGHQMSRRIPAKSAKLLHSMVLHKTAAPGATRFFATAGLLNATQRDWLQGSQLYTGKS